MRLKFSQRLASSFPRASHLLNLTMDARLKPPWTGALADGERILVLG